MDLVALGSAFLGADEEFAALARLCAGRRKADGVLVVTTSPPRRRASRPRRQRPAGRARVRRAGGAGYVLVMLRASRWCLPPRDRHVLGQVRALRRRLVRPARSLADLPGCVQAACSAGCRTRLRAGWAAPPATFPNPHSHELGAVMFVSTLPYPVSTGQALAIPAALDSAWGLCRSLLSMVLGVLIALLLAAMRASRSAPPRAWQAPGSRWRATRPRSSRCTCCTSAARLAGPDGGLVDRADGRHHLQRRLPGRELPAAA